MIQLADAIVEVFHIRNDSYPWTPLILTPWTALILTPPRTTGLAGATADVHCFDVNTKTWTK